MEEMGTGWTDRRDRQDGRVRRDGMERIGRKGGLGWDGMGLTNVLAF